MSDSIVCNENQGRSGNIIIHHRPPTNNSYLDMSVFLSLCHHKTLKFAACSSPVLQRIQQKTNRKTLECHLIQSREQLAPDNKIMGLCKTKKSLSKWEHLGRRVKLWTVNVRNSKHSSPTGAIKTSDKSFIAYQWRKHRMISKMNLIH